MSLLHGEFFRKIGRNAGEPVIWLRAVEGTVGPHGEVANEAGKYFVQQYLDDAVRVRFYTNFQDVQDEEYGTIQVMRTQMRYMPDEIQPLRDDRFIRPKRSSDMRRVLKPSSDMTRDLGVAYASKIHEIRGDGKVYLPSSYALLNGMLKWIGTPPSEQVVVFFSYLEAYEFLGDEWKKGPTDTDGVQLPSWIPLKLLTAGEGL